MGNGCVYGRDVRTLIRCRCTIVGGEPKRKAAVMKIAAFVTRNSCYCPGDRVRFVELSYSALTPMLDGVRAAALKQTPAKKSDHAADHDGWNRKRHAMIEVVQVAENQQHSDQNYEHSK